jgi:hypothetical protein
MSVDSRAGVWRMAQAWRYVVLSAFVLAGCATFDFNEGDGTYNLRVINRTDEVVQDVLIRDAGGSRPRHFGMMAQRDKEQSIASCPIKLNKQFMIMWYYNGLRGIKLMDLSKYLPYKDEIASIAFYYEGQGWSVVASDADGKEIKPSSRPPAKAR